MPAAMATRNSAPCQPPKVIDAIEGPGQRPESPQPMPNITDPMTSRRPMKGSG